MFEAIHNITAATMIFVMLGLVLAVGCLALVFPAVRRNQATFAPCLVILTLVVSCAAVFGIVVAYHHAVS